MRGTVKLPCAGVKARFETADGTFMASKAGRDGETILRVQGRFTAPDSAKGSIVKSARGGERCSRSKYTAALTDPSGVESRTIRYGPFDLDPMGDGAEETMTFTSPNIERPCADCYVIGMVPELTYANGETANLDRGAMLHHAVLFNQSRPDASCGGWPERFFATGNERTTFVMPNGYGYPVSSTDRWSLLAELMNMGDGMQTVYVDVTYYVVDGSARTQGVRPLWLDVNNCASSQYPIPAGSSDTEWDFTVPASAAGRIVAIGGHQHDAGVRIEAENVTRGETICDSRAGYGANPAYMGTLESMSGCVGDPVARIDSGDVLRLHSLYDSPEARDDVMGIMVAYVAS